MDRKDSYYILKKWFFLCGLLSVGKRDLGIYNSFMQMLTQYGKMQVISICKINRKGVFQLEGIYQ